MRWAGIIACMLAGCGSPIRQVCYLGTGQNCGPTLSISMFYALYGGTCDVTQDVQFESYLYSIKPTYEAPQPDGGPCFVGEQQDGGLYVNCLNSGATPVGCSATVCAWSPPPCAVCLQPQP